MSSIPYEGTELKYRVTIAATGFSQDDDEWSVTISRGNTSQTFSKSQCVRDEDGWLVLFDSADFGPGRYYATITAYVPDMDFDDGLRTEVTRVDLEPIKPL